VNRRRRFILVAVVATVLLLPPLLLAVAVLAVDYPADTIAPDRSDPVLVCDRDGGLLRSVPVPGSHRRHGWVALTDISPPVFLTLLASEDRNFFSHKGVDPVAVLRAAGLNLTDGALHYGASTLTMQLARMVHSEGRPRTLWNKLRETVIALRMERAMTKNQILEQYLNRAYFGNGAWGIEGAARTYFGKSAGSLSAGEAASLMVIPRGPSVYDPLRHPQRVLARRNHLLALLVKNGLLSAAQQQRALTAPVRFFRHPQPFAASHFVDFILDAVPPAFRRSGTIHTTLDPALQTSLERRTRGHVDAMASRGIQQAGAVVLDTSTGAILAMVGSAGKGTPAHQVNIAVRRRFPGSTLKPFVYAAAIEQGDAPATIALDIYNVPSQYRVRGTPPVEHGPASYREALAGSYNLAAVHVLERVGVPEVMEKLRLAGVGELVQSAEDYGLRLALGSARVRLLDLAAGYGFLVRGGLVRRPSGIARMAFADGTTWTPPSEPDVRVFSKEASWLVMDMLADNEARRKVFGDELPADLPFKVAVKTGTARGFSDVFAVFATREFTVAAWAGRFDGEPTAGVLGMDGAAPLARAGILLAGQGRPLTLPEAPAGIVAVDVCPQSGQLPSPHCPHRVRDWFIRGTVPEKECTLHVIRNGRPVADWPAEVKDWERRTAPQ